MSNLKGKGYGNKGSIFTFEVNGEKVAYSSNATRYDDAISKAGLPKGTKLIDATTFKLLDGKNNDVLHVDFIWAVKGTISSGKASVQYLLDKGAITQEQAQFILDSEETRI